MIERLILLVEDSPTDAYLFLEMLQEVHEKWQVIHVQRLQEALIQLEKQKFDVALLDLSLPDSQGLNIVGKIHEHYANLPLIVLTGLDSQAIGINALRLGAQDYLCKGKTDAELLEKTIRYAIERCESQRIILQQTVAMGAAREGIAILNHQHEYTYVNQAYLKLYGYQNIAELLGKNWSFVNDFDQNTPFTPEMQLVSQKRNILNESVGRRKDGSSFSQEISMTALNNGGFICLVRDVTERKKAELAMKQALQKERELNDLKYKFLSMVSHEYKNPMTFIKGAAQLLSEAKEKIPPDKEKYFLKEIQVNIDRMTQMIDEVLLLGKFEQTILKFQPKILNLTDFLQELINHFASVSSQNYQFDFTYDGNFEQVKVDEELIRHILNNLLSNAVKYSPEGGKINLHLRQEGEWGIVVEIKDEGIGISLEEQKHLFEAFYRCNNVGKIRGTGLGLSIVKECIELHGGKIELVSQLGSGTTFIVKLP